MVGVVMLCARGDSVDGPVPDSMRRQFDQYAQETPVRAVARRCVHQCGASTLSEQRPPGTRAIVTWCPTSCGSTRWR